MQNIIQWLGKGLVTVSIAVGGMLGIPSHINEPINVGATIPVSVATFQTSLQASITVTANSMTLVNGINKAGNPLSGYTCFNIDEGTSTEEFVCGTASGASITSMLRGLDPVNGTLEVTALKKIHRRGASVKITNYPALGIVSRILNGDESIPNKLTYSSVKTLTADTDIVDKRYVDDVVIGGTGALDASDSVKGFSKLSVAPVSPTAPIATGTNDPRIPVAYVVDAAGSDTYVINPSPAISSYVAGKVFTFQVGTANTGAASLNVSGLGAKTIKKDVSSDLVTGDILANQVVTVVYDGTNMQMASRTTTFSQAYTSKFSNGVSSKVVDDASTTQNIAHGLGVIPSRVKIFGFFNNGTITTNSTVVFDASGTHDVYWGAEDGGSNTASGTATTFQIAGIDPTFTGGQSGVITVDATNIIITWTKVSTPTTSTVTLLWEAQY